MTESLLNDKCRNFDDNFKRINEEIAAAALRSGREPGAVTLLAATKTVETEVINHAIQNGLRAMGENRVQEYLSKYDALIKDNCIRHFIGRLQSNKVKYIVDKVSCVQSVDSVKLASEIAKHSEKRKIVTGILVEVNIGSEQSKGGIQPVNLHEFIDEIRGFSGICIKGLMCIPPIAANSAESCRSFSKMHQYYVDMRSKKIDNVCMETLSMGMSDDYVQAIEQGATMVRIGSALFGRRV